MLARKIIRITCEDSPNVRLARLEIAQGLKPSGRIVIPGVLEWHQLVHRRKTWDPHRQAVGLDAIFYAGKDLKLFPWEWRDAAAKRAQAIYGQPRVGGGPKALGIDPAEGGDSSSFAVSDRLGLLRLESIKTPDTTVVPAHTIHLMEEYDIDSEYVAFDRGGGGKEHADRLRNMGYDRIRTVAFGEKSTPEMHRGISPFSERKETREDRTTYKNRRAEMYGELSVVLDPNGSGLGDVQYWAIPGPEVDAVFSELHRQLAVFPRQYDAEGVLTIPPKNAPPGSSEELKARTLCAMLGCSPDEADAVVLSLHALLHRSFQSSASMGSA